MPTARERTALWGRTIFGSSGRTASARPVWSSRPRRGSRSSFFWLFEILRERHEHPYAGILLFLILPAIFVLGLLLIPVGACCSGGCDRKERGRRHEPPPPIDLGPP